MNPVDLSVDGKVTCNVEDQGEAALQLDDFTSFNFLSKERTDTFDDFYPDLGIDPLMPLSPDHKFNFDLPIESIEDCSNTPDNGPRQQMDGIGNKFDFFPDQTSVGSSLKPATSDEREALPKGMKVESNDPLLFTTSPECYPQEDQNPTTPVSITTHIEGRKSSPLHQKQETEHEPNTLALANSPRLIPQISPRPRPRNQQQCFVPSPFTPVHNRVASLAPAASGPTGRRRSQSMPAPEFSFHRRLESGDLLTIGRPIPSQRYSTADKVVQRHHPYELSRPRANDRYNIDLGGNGDFRSPGDLRSNGGPIDNEYWQSFRTNPSIPQQMYHPTGIVTAPSSPAGGAGILQDEYGIVPPQPGQPRGLSRGGWSGQKRGFSSSPRTSEPGGRKTRGKKIQGDSRRGTPVPDPKVYCESELDLDRMGGRMRWDGLQQSRDLEM